MSGKLETDVVQTILQTLHKEIVKNKVSHANDQKFVQKYIEQVKNE